MHLSTCLLRLHTFINLQTTSVPLSVSVFSSLSFFSLPDCELEGSRVFRMFLCHLPVVCPCQPACVWLLTLSLSLSHTHTHTPSRSPVPPPSPERQAQTPHIFPQRTKQTITALEPPFTCKVLLKTYMLRRVHQTS